MTREKSLEVGCECEFCQADEHPRWEYLFARVKALEVELALVKAERDRFLYVKNLASQSDASAEQK
jgi:hypothetical protein